MTAPDLTKLVKPLVWDRDDAHLLLSEPHVDVRYEVFPRNDGGFYAARNGTTIGRYETETLAIAASNADHAARVVAGLDGEVIAEMVGALKAANEEISAMKPTAPLVALVLSIRAILAKLEQKT